MVSEKTVSRSTRIFVAMGMIAALPLVLLRTTLPDGSFLATGAVSAGLALIALGYLDRAVVGRFPAISGVGLLIGGIALLLHQAAPSPTLSLIGVWVGIVFLMAGAVVGVFERRRRKRM